MSPASHHPVPSSGPSPEALEEEILRLEAELQRAETTLNAFHQAVQARFGEQLRCIRELTTLYKQQKAAKKEKRREQKRRGKNYQEPTGLIRQRAGAGEEAPDDADNAAELKRLYREAIVQVHPDKHPDADTADAQRAAALTTHLNDLYERGDLDALRDFHEHILGEKPLQHTPYVAGTVRLQEAVVPMLQRKKEQLAAALQALLQSQTYHLALEPDRAALLEELRRQFDDRIAQLRRRTRQ